MQNLISKYFSFLTKMSCYYFYFKIKVNDFKARCLSVKIFFLFFIYFLGTLTPPGWYIGIGSQLLVCFKAGGLSTFKRSLNMCNFNYSLMVCTWAAALVHLNFRAGSTFPVPVCTVSLGHWVNKADTE